MTVLLDTHVFLWMDSAPSQLSPTAVSICQDRANQLVVSVASLWEMQIKQQAGKLTLRVPLQQMISEQQSKNGIVLLDIRLEHVLALDGLPPYHKDPFDRLMIAQANAEGIAILSADSVFAQYPVHLLT